MKLLLSSIYLLVLIQFDCSSQNTLSSDQSQVFIVKVDSISHSPTVLYRDTISIKLYGTIGYDGCSSYLGYDEIKLPTRLELTMKGERKGSYACPAVMVYLDGFEYKTIASQYGWYRINIHQPDGSLLKDSLFVH